MPRRPAPIVLPKLPMDTLWEVDESSDAASKQRFTPAEPLRSVFEDDDEDEVRHSFPLPPSVKRFFTSRMNLPIHSPPKRTPPRPRRAPPPPPRVPSPVPAPVRRPVSPTSSASSSDTETPRTPPMSACSLPKVLPTPPPAEWESAIDALFEFAEEQDQMQRPKLAPRSVSAPVVPARSARRSQMPFSPGSDSSFVCMSPSTAFPMSPTSGGWSVDRPLMSPGFMPMSVSPPSQRWLSLAS